MPPDPTPSETLRAAAARLRTGSPLVAPSVAEPLAAWLELEAEWISGVFPIHREHSLAVARSILEQP